MALYHINYSDAQISGQVSNFTAGAIAADIGVLLSEITEDNVTSLQAFTKAN